ncbi:MAG: hypothetical protein ACI8S6_004019 [Myxococcota bacterium]
MSTMLLIPMLAALASEPVTEPVSGGAIDWSELRLEVTIASNHSRGAWQDRRLQEQDAFDQLSNRITRLAEDVPITAELTAGELMASGGELGARLRSGVERWSVEEARYFTRGGVELVGVLDLRTWLWPVLVEMAEADELPAPTDVSGLLIDARGVDMPLSMSPLIRTATGRTLVEPSRYSPAAARRRAPVLFVSDPADPAAAGRAGAAPLLLRASSVDDDGALVLSVAAERLASEPSVAALVSRGDIVIVVDQ